MRLEAKLCRVTGFALARRIGAILVIEPPVRGHLLQGLLDTLHTLAPGMTCTVNEKRNCRRIFCDQEQCRQHCEAAPGRRLTREDPAVFVQATCGITASLLVSSFYQWSYRRLSIWLNPWTFQVTSAGERAMASPAIRGSCRQDRLEDPCVLVSTDPCRRTCRKPPQLKTNRLPMTGTSPSRRFHRPYRFDPWEFWRPCNRYAHR